MLEQLALRSKHPSFETMKFGAHEIESMCIPASDKFSVVVEGWRSSMGS